MHKCLKHGNEIYVKFSFLLCSIFQIFNSIFFPVIDAKPIGQHILPLEYLQCREKPAAYFWDEWYEFANEQYKQHQMKLLEQQEKDEQAHQARIEAQKKHKLNSFH